MLFTEEAVTKVVIVSANESGRTPFLFRSYSKPVKSDNESISFDGTSGAEIWKATRAASVASNFRSYKYGSLRRNIFLSYTFDCY